MGLTSLDVWLVWFVEISSGREVRWLGLGHY